MTDRVFIQAHQDEQEPKIQSVPKARNADRGGEPSAREAAGRVLLGQRPRHLTATGPMGRRLVCELPEGGGCPPHLPHLPPQSPALTLNRSPETSLCLEPSVPRETLTSWAPRPLASLRAFVYSLVHHPGPLPLFKPLSSFRSGLSGHLL